MENSERKSPKRLVIDIDEEVHQQIKLRSAIRNITIRKWVSRALSEALKKEEQYDK